MEKKRWDCAALPKGWKMEEVTRKSGLSAGKSDVYYFRYCTHTSFLNFIVLSRSELANGAVRESKTRRCAGRAGPHKVWDVSRG